MAAIFRIIELDVLKITQFDQQTPMEFVEAKDSIDAIHKFYEKRPNASNHILAVLEEHVDEHWRNPNNSNIKMKTKTQS